MRSPSVATDLLAVAWRYNCGRSTLSTYVSLSATERLKEVRPLAVAVLTSGSGEFEPTV